MKEPIVPHSLANKMLDLILSEKDLLDALTHGDTDGSGAALETILMATAMIASRVTATHLSRFMDRGVEMKVIMEISDEISQLSTEYFDEFLADTLTLVAKDIDSEGKTSKVKPTSH